jgi:hypothetical protein
MVNDQNQDTLTEPARQGVRDVASEPDKIGASTPYDFGERFHITLERVDRCSIQSARDTPLIVAGQVPEVSLGIAGEFTRPSHPSTGSRGASSPPSPA